MATEMLAVADRTRISLARRPTPRDGALMTTTAIRHAVGLITVLLTAGALATPATGQGPAPVQPRHPCPVLVVSQRPWQNVKDGKKTEWGDHWLLQWQGQHASCAMAAAVARAEIIHPSHERSNCAWETRQGPGIVTTPFHHLVCAPRRLGTTRSILVVAFVDPDPTFIHPGAAPKGNQ
jgi:hypothetical protein